MPTYSFRCPSCHREHDRVYLMREISHVRPSCSHCTVVLERVFKLGAVQSDKNFGDAPGGGHYNIHTDKMHSRSEQADWERSMQAKGYETGPRESAGKRRDPGQKWADQVARHGPKAMGDKRLDFQKKNPSNQKKRLTPNQAFAISERRRRAAKGRG